MGRGGDGKGLGKDVEDMKLAMGRVWGEEGRKGVGERCRGYDAGFTAFSRFSSRYFSDKTPTFDFIFLFWKKLGKVKGSSAFS